jgi:hypothetical protein
MYKESIIAYFFNFLCRFFVDQEAIYIYMSSSSVDVPKPEARYIG